MSMHIFNKIIVFIFLILVFSSCQKDDIVYDINQLQSSSYNANKNKLKSVSQYISIVYANLFQKALSSNVIIPSDSLMRADLDLFLEETYKRFFVRDITEAEREFFLNYLNANPNVSSEMVYMSFALSNEYQFY